LLSSVHEVNDLIKCVWGGKHLARTWHGWYSEGDLFGVRRVMSTSSALRLRLALTVSERTGEDTGVWNGALSDAVATAATREKDGIRI
jgi:hypothetical protein